MADEPTSERYVGVAVIVFDGHEQILLGKRKGGFMPGMYGAPGGRLDCQEPIEAAAHRELTEETALIATELEYVGTVREWQDTQSFISFVYSCRHFTGTPTTTEPNKCEGWEWYSLSNLPNNIIRGHQAAIELCKDKTTRLIDITT